LWTHSKEISKAPNPCKRYEAMKLLNDFNNHCKQPIPIMISIEPILDFKLDIMIKWIKRIQPDFVSIGADSKGNNLSEPPSWKVKKLIEELEKFTEVRIKKNLNRLYGGKIK